MPDAETILDAADFAREAGFANAGDQLTIAVIFFALLCLGVWLGDRQKEPQKSERTPPPPTPLSQPSDIGRSRGDGADSN
ncbi:MAG: hypothetical protein KME43_07520 [Myxacorys chilensis ATA2-1-KO14]|nr:hypothetical protein [Myxacorys chilensis ATA2-1-KO14]